MRIHGFYFSPTGGTKKVMDYLTEDWNMDSWVDLSVRDFDYSQYQYGQEDVCVIGVPSYGGRVPEAALARMREMRVENATAVLVVVYGNRAYDDTLLELKTEAAACGFVVKAAVGAIAEHSIVREYGAGRPDEADQHTLKKFAMKIYDFIGKTDALTGDLKVPGNTPYREYHGVPIKPKGGRGCVSCGKCASLCPVGAIPADNPASLDEKVCISCMRCVLVCPEHVRKVNPVMLLGTSQKLKKVCSTRKENELFLSAEH